METKLIQKMLDEFETSKKLPKYILDQIKDNLPKDISEKKLKEVLENVKEEYENSLISENESIGVITAQSFGEPATQMTLNTFHFAGVAAQSVEGLPRIIEILDMRKEISNPIMKIFLKDEFNSENGLKDFARKIKETKLIEIVENIDMDVVNKKISFGISQEDLGLINLKIDEIPALFDKKYKTKFEINGNTIIINEAINASIKDISSTKEIISNVIIRGIKGISDITIAKEKGEIFLLARGSSLKKVLKYEEVDETKIYSNNIHEVYSCFGVEAARMVIIKEIQDVVESQGLSVNFRHIELIGDVMTQSGVPKGMTRFGVIADKVNVLTKASFETSLKHISQGALICEEDALNSITENIMTNQIAYVGTGIPKIKVRK